MQERTNQRFIILAGGVVLIFLAMLLQLVNLQVINGAKNDLKAQTRVFKERIIDAPRGNIMDRNGVAIAVNRVGYTVRVSSTGLKDKENNEMILKIIQLFEKNNDTYINNLGGYLTFDPIDYGTNIKDSPKAIERWKKDLVYKNESIDFMKTPYDVFNFFKKKFNVDPKYTDEEAYKIISVRYDMIIQGYTNANPIDIAKDIKVETIAQLEERYMEFPGIQIETIPYRKYVDPGNIAHILGYIGSMSPEEYEKYKPLGYRMNEKIGKDGIEKSAEKFLKGTNGQKRMEVDTKGRITEDLGGTPAIPGHDVVLTIDSKLQDAAMRSLQENIELIKSQADYKKNFGDAFSGAAVVMDVRNGEILAMASYPSYDPTVFLEGNWKAIKELNNDNENRPLFNRAIQGAYTPGSTYKPLTAIAGLETGIISVDNSIIEDRGTHVIGGWTFHCLEEKYGHGRIDLVRAMATSCNIYFHELGVDVTIDNIDKWAKEFGLGEKTGIELPGEVVGIRANKETKKKIRNDDWRRADTAQAAIGQFDNIFTPLQLANFVSTIANGGKKYTPHIIKRIKSYEGKIIEETKPQFVQLPIKKENMELVQKGMKEVLNAADGTAQKVFEGVGLSVAGKTGTPETGREAMGHSSNGLFIAYAPAENPEVAVAIVIEQGVWGSNAAPVAKDILIEYFGLKNSTKPKNDDTPLNKNIFIH